MRKHLHWLLSASLGLGGVAFMGCERNSGGNPQANKDSSQAADSKILNNKNDAASVAGSKIPGDQIGTIDLTRIYGALKDVSEDAFTKNHFDNLVGKFTSPDKDRIGKGFANQKFDDLDGRIDQLNKDYKAKYGHSFDIEKTKVFENWVAVQKTGTMYRGERAAEAVADVGCFLGAHRPGFLHDPIERLAADEVHPDADLAADFARAVHGDDVLIRDSKGRGVIATSRAEWDAFLNGCKGGVFDGI